MEKIKTLEEIKDDVSIDMLRGANWEWVKRDSCEFREPVINEICYRYASQYKELNAELLEALKVARSMMQRDKVGGFSRTYSGGNHWEEGSTYEKVFKAITKAEQSHPL